MKHRNFGRNFSQLFLAITLAGAGAFGVAAETSANDAPETGDALVIQPGDARFDTPSFDDYQAVYSSSSSKTGGFTFQARKSGDGKKLAMIDIIPMADTVIVAQRQIDLTTHRAEFSAGPYFAWGREFIVSQSTGDRFSWTRVPIGAPVDDGDDAKDSNALKQIAGEIQNGGYISEMFSPTLAALMPMPVGTKFRAPEAYPRKGESVSSEFDDYQVLRKEALTLASGFSCDCWVIEKRTWSGMTELIWVAREAPFVFRRVRDVGGSREFSSDLLAYQTLDK